VTRYSYAASGLTLQTVTGCVPQRFLAGRGEWVLEVGRLRRERRSVGKTDALASRTLT
jgi:hypothetical protein